MAAPGVLHYTIRQQDSQSSFLGEFTVIILNVVLHVIVLDGGLDGLLGQNGAVQLVRGQSAQRIDDLLIGQRQRIVQASGP